MNADSDIYRNLWFHRKHTLNVQFYLIVLKFTLIWNTYSSSKFKLDSYNFHVARDFYFIFIYFKYCIPLAESGLYTCDDSHSMYGSNSIKHYHSIGFSIAHIGIRRIPIHVSAQYGEMYTNGKYISNVEPAVITEFNIMSESNLMLRRICLCECYELKVKKKFLLYTVNGTDILRITPLV